MSKFLNQKLYKNEIIMEQYFNGSELKILTKSDGKWTLWNVTQNKKISSSKDRTALLEKLYTE